MVSENAAHLSAVHASVAPYAACIGGTFKDPFSELQSHHLPNRLNNVLLAVPHLKTHRFEHINRLGV